MFDCFAVMIINSTDHQIKYQKSKNSNQKSYIINQKSKISMI